MSSIMYSTKNAKKSYHPIASPLGPDDVLELLHSHFSLASIFWPPPGTAKNPGIAISEERQTAPNATEFCIGPAAGSGSGLSSSAARGKASITSHKERGEIVVEETMPLGLEMTLVYRVVTDVPPDSDENLLLTSSSGLYLEVERSVLAPRPFSFLVKTTEGPIRKTEDLLWVLDEMGRNGKDLGAALDGLRVRGDVVKARSKDKAD